MATTAPPDESYGQGKADNACVVCRSRKVRCDKTLPGCLNCNKLGVPCPGFASEDELKSRKDVEKSADDIFKAAGVEKRKVGSCEECRSSKHRCTKTKPSCRRCIVRRIPCVYSSRPDSVSSKRNARAAKRKADAENGRQQARIVPHPIYNRDLAARERQAHLSLSSSEEPSPPPGLLGVDPASLCTDTLPNNKNLQLRLLELFFNQTASLRLLSFVHRPSFMEAFERGTVATEYGESLLYIMCALGARSAFFEEYIGRRGQPEQTDKVEMPGAKWAERARNDVLLQIHSPTIQHLMAMLLICEYGLLESRNAMVFTMIAFVYRFLRLLSLDTPGKLDENATEEERMQRECEIRIVWACYFVDAMVGTGVEKNLFWTDDLPAIPLPSASYNAPFKDAQEYYLDLLDSALLGTIVPRLDYQAISLLAVTLRTRVMREIRNPDDRNDPWHHDSKLNNILRRVKVIQDNLPREYSLSPANVGMMTRAGILGGVFAMHILLHAVVFDLTRVSLPGFSFPLAERFKAAPSEFVQHCQQQCFSHAEQVSHLIRNAIGMDRMAYSDAFCADVAMESAKIQIIYSATLSGMPQLVSNVRTNARCNFDLLLILSRSWETKMLILQGLLPVCEMFGYTDLVEQYNLKRAEEVEVSGHQDTHHLSILAAFRLGRSELQERNDGPAATRASRTLPPVLIQASGRAPVRKMSVKGSTQLEKLSELVKSSSAEQGSSESRARKPLQLLPSIGSRGRSIFQPSMEDYKVTASNASELIKRGLSDLPSVSTRRRRRSTLTDRGNRS